MPATGRRFSKTAPEADALGQGTVAGAARERCATGEVKRKPLPTAKSSHKKNSRSHQNCATLRSKKTDGEGGNPDTAGDVESASLR